MVSNWFSGVSTEVGKELGISTKILKHEYFTYVILELIDSLSQCNNSLSHTTSIYLLNGMLSKNSYNS